MGLFNQKDDKEIKNEQKELEKMQKLISKYNLGELSRDNLENLKNISNTMASNNLFKAGLALSFANATDQAKIGYLDVLVEQNFMIIRQLNEISRKLNK